MQKIKKYMAIKKGEGIILAFLKSCFWMSTLIYGYQSVCTVVVLLKRLIRQDSPGTQLPSAINIEKLWLNYTAAYLVICVIHVLLVELMRFIHRKRRKA